VGALLQVRNLRKHFEVRKGLFFGKPAVVRAVDGVSFDVAKGESLGLVGESGCGKSTTARLILRLIQPTSGEAYFEDIPIFQADKAEMQTLRRKMQIIFQDSYSSLNPRMTIEKIVGEGMVVHHLYRPQERRERVAQLLKRVGLSPDHLKRYPHEFSGGQRQRIGIARALAVEPKLIVADEPVSALDVSIQAQMINLLQDLQEELNLTYLFISHDLRVVEQISDRVAVMYLGRIVEITSSQELYQNPLHPYTEALLSAIPVPDPQTKRPRIILEGDPPSPITPPSGCPFHPRCPRRFDRCPVEEPRLKPVNGDRFVACHLYDEKGMRD